MVSDTSNELIPAKAADDLVAMLQAGMYEDFLALYRSSAKGVQNGAVILAELVNEKMRNAVPPCETTLVVSQQLEDKHIVAIQDGSRFFGDTWTVTRNIFMV